MELSRKKGGGSDEDHTKRMEVPGERGYAGAAEAPGGRPFAQRQPPDRRRLPHPQPVF